ncbi:unnamed protein product [Blepharisma stoltei]|uniref:Uncharacterized protein n=1 Tax=Blepharisma stoltei TaxID=1481888 RepID=A0AAU9IWD8_9CILI|nr:unnamed protein product [Blepharisma stoltei]
MYIRPDILLTGYAIELSLLSFRKFFSSRGNKTGVAKGNLALARRPSSQSSNFLGSYQALHLILRVSILTTKDPRISGKQLKLWFSDF